MNLAPAIRSPLVNDQALRKLLASFEGAPAVFTRRPVPNAYPCAVVSPDVTVGDQDLLVTQIPVVTRDIAVYGGNETAAKYRVVEAAAYRVREIFHRSNAIALDGWHIIDVTASGPIAAPTDDIKRVGRLVSLSIRMMRV